LLDEKIWLKAISLSLAYALLAKPLLSLTPSITLGDAMFKLMPVLVIEFTRLEGEPSPLFSPVYDIRCVVSMFNC